MCRQRLLANPVLAALAFYYSSLAVPVQAQGDSLVEDSACRTCHEDLYYLYDTGKWYCLCREQRTCTACHNGVDSIWDAEAAHTGLLVNRLAQDAAICQDCHPQDAQVYVEKFAAAAWLDLQATPAPTQTAYEPIVLAAGEEPSTPALEPEPFKPWKKLAFGLFGPGFLGVTVFGFQCWREDCRSSRQAVSRC